MSIIEKRKQKKMNLVFTTVRENPDYTKTEIKASTGLSMESVIQYVDTLVQDNCLYYSGSKGANVGRKGDCLRVNPDGAYFIGTKFTDLTVDTVLANLAGDIIANESTTVTAASMTVDELIKHIFAGIDNILCTLDSAHKQKIKAIGIAAPGFIDSEQGIVRGYFNIADGATIRLRQILEERYGIATYMSHTVKTKAIAYRLQPQNTGKDNFIYIFVGNGVAMATFMSGKLYKSPFKNDGEIGHIIIDENGEKCACGRRGCLETVVGNEAIVKRMRSSMQNGGFACLQNKRIEDITIDDFVLSVNAGDKDAVALVDEAARHIAYIAAMAITVIGESKIVFCGEYIYTERFQSSFRRFFERYCLNKVCENLSVEYIKNDKRTNAFDAAMYAYYRKFYGGSIA